MIHVATILPVAHLGLTSKNIYHMVLAQFIDVDKRYTQFFMFQRALGKFLLLDNGAAEGCQPTMKELIPKIKKLYPTEIVLPDTPMNMQVTLRKGQQALQLIHHTFDKRYYFPRTMAVPQGANIQEWVLCAKEMLRWPIQAFGISKFLTSKVGADARIEVLEQLYLQCSAEERTRLAQIDIHFLGCHIHPKETAGALYLGNRFRLRGTDSAIAYIYTQAGIKITADVNRPEGEIDFLKGKVANTIMLRRNIKRWEGFSNGLL